MVGGFVSLYHGQHRWAALRQSRAFWLAVVACTAPGVDDRASGLYRPLRGASPLAVLITAIGVSYLLQNAALLNLRLQRDVQFTSVVNCAEALKLAGGALSDLRCHDS